MAKKKVGLEFPTENQLKSYLRNTKRKAFKQGDSCECVLAAYFKDNVVGETCFGLPTRVEVDGDTASLYINDENVQTVSAPDWASEYISVFDSAPDGSRETALAVVGATIEDTRAFSTDFDVVGGSRRIVKGNKVLFDSGLKG